MRRLAAAILAAPVVASIYIATLLAVPGARRNLAGIAAVLLVVVVGVSVAMPPAASSRPPSTPQVIAGDRLQPVQTSSVGPAATPDGAPAAIAAILPGLIATAAETASRPPETVILDITGAPGLKRVEHASPVVRKATGVRVTGTEPSGKRIRLTSDIMLRFDRPVTLSGVRSAFRIAPAVRGTIRLVSPKVYTFTPAAPLPANTRYVISFARPIIDADGIAVTAPKPSAFLTVAAPGLVRFRPFKGTGDVDPTAAISVRFTRPMDRAVTARAFSVVVAGRKIKGTIGWGENDTVLVFQPSAPLPRGKGVGVRVLGTARSAEGVSIKAGGSATFQVMAAPIKPKPVTRTSGTRRTVPRSGGGALGGGAWAAAESYYLRLMNCTRTGGWVGSSGSCDSPGGRDVAPLVIDEGISDRVSRPYAKYLATTGICSHFADGNPGTRLRREGYSSYVWAENISCPLDMAPMALMVYTQQFFQSEKSYNGGHYVNLMNAAYDRVGIGVWVANGRAEVVIDFYHP